MIKWFIQSHFFIAYSEKELSIEQKQGIACTYMHDLKNFLKKVGLFSI